MHATRGQSFRHIGFIVGFVAIAGSDLTTQKKISLHRDAHVHLNATVEVNALASGKWHVGKRQRSHKILLQNPRSENRHTIDLPIETYLGKLFQGCGEVCNTSMVGAPGKFFSEVKKKVDCMGLFNNAQSDAPAKEFMWPPPKAMPEALKEGYTMGGDATLVSDPGMFFTQRYSGGNALTPLWSKGKIDDFIKLASRGELNGTYGVKKTNEIKELIKKHSNEIKGKRMFVIGSEQPWLEALLLLAGATHVTTIEYGKILSEDHRVSTMTPAELRQKFVSSAGKEPRFDGGATYSSIEHAGLGRYGDSLNPWGDLQAMAKSWCITKPKGTMFVGVPTAEKDLIYWNAHRVYGPKRWAQLMANWHQTDRAGIDSVLGTYVGGPTYVQPMLVAKRMDDS